MKKFLVGIVTLVAAVMLSSPAFGAFSNPFTAKDGSKLTFWQDVLANDFSTPKFEALDVSDIQPGKVIDTLQSTWGNAIAQVEIDETGWGDTGIFYFNAPVQIVSAKWDGVQYAWMFSDQVMRIDYDLTFGLSNVRGYNVPVPAAVWLLGSGMLGLVAVRRRRS